jgi:hypothetical protein
VVIIKGGIMGTAPASHAPWARLKSLVLEKRDGVELFPGCQGAWHLL